MPPEASDSSKRSYRFRVKFVSSNLKLFSSKGKFTDNLESETVEVLTHVVHTAVESAQVFVDKLDSGYHARCISCLRRRGGI